MMNSVALMIDGYNHDPREIYTIPEVRAFYKQLWEVWPYWLYFCNLDTENLMMMVMCCLESLDALKVKGQSQVKVSIKWCLRKSKASEMVEEGSEHDEACEGCRGFV